MSRTHFRTLCAAVVLVVAMRPASAQLARTRTPQGDASTPNPAASMPRMPYAGEWRGIRNMPVGTDEIGLSFTVTNDKYSSVIVRNGGAGKMPASAVTTTASGLSWEQPNSGGGIWVYHVRLASADSLSGTLTLRDAPANLNPVPSGTLTLVRVASPDAARRKK